MSYWYLIGDFARGSSRTLEKHHFQGFLLFKIIPVALKKNDI